MNLRLVYIKLFTITDHAGVFLFVVTHDVDQPQVISGEEETVEISPVHILTSPPALDSLDQGRHHGAGSLHHVVQVPGREEDSRLVALVRVDGVMVVFTAVLVISPLAAEHPAKK